MARTVDVAARTVRREAFLDAAERLIQTKGYEQMSIQDVLDALDASRGAFYHYFDSKESLLDALVERFADAAMAPANAILADPSLRALEKLEKVLRGIAQFKAEQKALVVAMIEVQNSDGNVLYREKLRRMTADRLGPILSTVIRQGLAEGSVRTAFPHETATVLITMVQGYQRLATDHFVARQAGTISFDEVQRTYSAFTEAFERILGITPGSVRLVDDATLHFWFG